MFSTLASFLPSALNNDKSKFVLDTESDEVKVPSGAASGGNVPAEDSGLKSKKEVKERRSANETFIFVRPPPSKSNHPLNLQVQLVPPNTRGPSGLASSTPNRQSVDLSSAPASPTDENATLSRTSSNRSSTSSASYSGYGSTASFASTASASSTRRTIIPLYNLQAHNVLTNVIVDAGTDAKIAKFQKRGIELIDLALFEPIEVWGDSSTAPGGRTSVDELGLKPSGFSARSAASNTMNLGAPPHTHDSRPVTPDAGTPGSSALSLPSSSSHSHAPPSPSPTPVLHGKRSIFGKMFSKKPPISSSPYLPEIKPTKHTRTPSTPSASASLATPKPNHRPTSTQLTPVPLSPAPSITATPTQSQIQQQQNQPRPLILGIQPTLNRALLYVWVVRRWFKRPSDPVDPNNHGGSLSNGMLSVNAGMNNLKQLGQKFSFESDGRRGGVEVRFEWKRGSAPGAKLRAKKGSPEGRTGRRGTIGVQDENRLSVISQQSVSTGVSVGASEEGGAPDSVGAGRRKHRKEKSPVPASRVGRGGKRGSLLLGSAEGGDGDEDEIADDIDEGAESDPEDSETPWVCTLKLRRLLARGEGEGGSVPPPILRVKVGTLSPTPHHPKVVAMLKVPFPLPEVEVESMEVVGKRAPQNHPILPTTRLTAEEIKDVVCSTGMWLVVREGFGGVGKVSRKGDGWRIRG
ncbi:hypothetical protein BD779DRAFT_1516989 [Infundibulicybe gibba]|nr:hypothetical protein BD779DRAFT_1516989 [Infundibulicybe gibba]